jgi:TRAP-type C4-dicarboxylate transport system permease small subunit
MRRSLDTLYAACGALACFFLASIAALVILQIATRFFGYLVPGLIEFATYAMVASVFLGMAQTLVENGHIRVTLILFALPPPGRRAFEIASLAVASGVMLYFTFYAADLVKQSWQFGYRDQGMMAVPLWLPQSGMALGAAVATIAFCDALVSAAIGRPRIVEASGLTEV